MAYWPFWNEYFDQIFFWSDFAKMEEVEAWGKTKQQITCFSWKANKKPNKMTLAGSVIEHDSPSCK